MPYRRAYHGRRPVRRFAKGKKLNKRQKREVKRIVGNEIEVKMFPAGNAAVGITNSPTFVNLFTPSQGVGGYGNRDGDTVHLKRMICRFQAVGGDIYNTMRVILFRWNGPSSPSASQPTVNDLFDTTSAGAEYVMCPAPAWGSEKKVHIIYDSVKTLPQTNYNTGQITGTSNSIKTWKHTAYGKKLGAKTVRFSPGTTVIPSGSIWMVAVSDSAIATNPSLYWNIRTEFTDA